MTVRVSIANDENADTGRSISVQVGTSPADTLAPGETDVYYIHRGAALVIREIEERPNVD